ALIGKARLLNTVQLCKDPNLCFQRSRRLSLDFKQAKVRKCIGGCRDTRNQSLFIAQIPVQSSGSALCKNRGKHFQGPSFRCEDTRCMETKSDPRLLDRSALKSEA